MFISHKQGNAADQVHTMSLHLRNLGAEVWYDMNAEDLTRAGMVAGIHESATFVLFLSHGVLERPFCQLEIRRAMQENKPIVLVHEEDSRHGKFDFAEFDAAPVDIAVIGQNHESLPYRRRKHEAEAFYAELSRRIQRAMVHLGD